MIGWLRLYRQYQEGRRLNNLLIEKIDETGRYRLAWESARRRANNHSGSVVFWKELAEKRFVEIQKLNDRIARLNVDVNEARAAITEKPKGMGDITPSVVSVPLGSRDRANAVRLANEADRLRAENEELRRANARLAVRCDELETQASKGIPS